MDFHIEPYDEKKNHFSKPFKMESCNHCMHQNDVDIHSMENVFCSYWVEVVPKKHSCKKFKSFNIPKK